MTQCHYPSCQYQKDCSVNRKFRVEHPKPAIRVWVVVVVLALFLMLGACL
jgi:hypothetical protein